MVVLRSLCVGGCGFDAVVGGLRRNEERLLVLLGGRDEAREVDRRGGVFRREASGLEADGGREAFVVMLVCLEWRADVVIFDLVCWSEVARL